MLLVLRFRGLRIAHVKQIQATRAYAKVYKAPIIGDIYTLHRHLLLPRSDLTFMKVPKFLNRQNKRQ